MLTDAEIRALKPAGKTFMRADGWGLYVMVRPSGVKSWRFIYYRFGRQRWLTFGLYRDVTLAQARGKLADARRLVAAGKDPAVVNPNGAAKVETRTFSFALETFLRKRKGVVEPLTHERDSWFLKKRCAPKLGRLLLTDITARHVLDMAETIADKHGAYSAGRAKQLVGQVLRFSIAQGWIETDVTLALKRALMAAKVRHFPALTDPNEIGTLLRAIDGLPEGVTRCALQLAPLVFVRPGELLHAEWTEVDLPAKLWRIPAAKMKMREAHLVPLSTQAVTILEAVKEFSRHSRYVFPSLKSPRMPLSSAALSKALHGLGYKGKHSPHGFRATARTLLAEVLNVDPYLIENQLAHAAPGPLGRAYDRARYVKARTTMMAQWSDYLDTLRVP